MAAHVNWPICCLHENGVEFYQKLIGNILSGLPLQNYAIARQNRGSFKQVCVFGKYDHVLAHCGGGGGGGGGKQF